MVKFCHTIISSNLGEYDKSGVTLHDKNKYYYRNKLSIINSADKGKELP